MIIDVPEDCFEITHEFKPEDWAPGVWAGTEGLTLVVKSVDLEKRLIVLGLAEKNKTSTTVGTATLGEHLGANALHQAGFF